jgi:hypothetical protein
VSAFDQPYVTRARSLGGIFRLKFHTLPFSQQLENSATHGTAMEEMLDTALIANETEALVDEKACDSPGWHDVFLRCASSWGKSQALHEPLVSEV